MGYNFGDIGIETNKAEYGKRMAYPISKLKQVTIPTYDGSNQPVHPYVLYFPQKWNGYKYWMCYTPYPDSDNDYENPSIAVSNDRVTWITPPGLTNPVVDALTAPQYNRDPSLIYDPDNNQLRLYWEDSLARLYYKTSTNGVVWSASQLCTGFSTEFGMVRKSATEWEAWTQSDVRCRNNDIGRYISTDGITWTRTMSAKTNLAKDVRIWHLSVTADESGYHFIASTYYLNNLSQKQLLYGYSRDGADIVFDTTPILMRDGFCDREVYQSCIVPVDNQKYVIFASGQNTLGKWGIGVMEVRTNNPSSALTGIITPRKGGVKNTIFNKIQIRDTSMKLPSDGGSDKLIVHEFNEYENKTLLIYNTHDQPIDISINLDIRAYGSFDTLRHGTTEMKFTVPASGTFTPLFINKTNLSALGEILPWWIMIGAKAGVAPTTGELTVILQAW